MRISKRFFITDSQSGRSLQKRGWNVVVISTRASGFIVFVRPNRIVIFNKRLKPCAAINVFLDYMKW